MQPSGRVTLVFTDLEGSTTLLEELGPEAYRRLLGEHRQAVAAALEVHEGYEVDSQGDGFFLAFGSAQAALAAIDEVNRATTGTPLRMRAGMHTGTPLLDPPKYIGRDVHLAARIMALGHGGQVLVSEAAVAELGASPELMDLGPQILKGFEEPCRVYQVGRAEFPALRSLSRSSLPTPANTIIGRDEEALALAELLDSHRLVSIVGPGGVGKTRLAIEVSASALRRYPDGVWWLDLSAVRQPGLVASALARAVEADGGDVHDGLVEALCAELQGRRLLVLVDNAEHLVDEVAKVIERLLTVPGPSFLVTSRERLDIGGERVVPVGALPPAAATALFLERARGQGVDLVDSTEIGQLCERLDRLPLAIELAAARTVALSPAEIVANLDQRLDLLTGPRTATRHRSLRTMIEWSYELLGESDRRLFESLAFLVGGWTLETARQAFGASPTQVEGLVRRSLVRPEDGRFRMLDLLHEFGRDAAVASGRARAIKEQVADHLADLADLVADGLEGPEPSVWANRVADEVDNLRSGLVWADEEGWAETYLRITAGLLRFLGTSGRVGEAVALAERALALNPEPSRYRVRVLYLGGFLSDVAGFPDRALAWLEEAVALGATHADVNLQLLAGITLAGTRSEAGGEARSRAMDDLLALLPRAREVGGQPLAAALTNLSHLALIEGQNEAAARYAEEGLVAYEKRGDPFGQCLCLCNMALAAVLGGDHPLAVDRARRALAIAVPQGDSEAIAAALVILALTHADGDPATACRLAAGAEALLARQEINEQAPEGRVWLGLKADLERALSEPDRRRLEAEGRAASLEELVELATSF